MNICDEEKGTKSIVKKKTNTVMKMQPSAGRKNSSDIVHWWSVSGKTISEDGQK